MGLYPELHCSNKKNHPRNWMVFLLRIYIISDYRENLKSAPI